MEYQKIKLASETITIKDAEPSEIEGLIPIYKENFPSEGYVISVLYIEPKKWPL